MNVTAVSGNVTRDSGDRDRGAVFGMFFLAFFCFISLMKFFANFLRNTAITARRVGGYIHELFLFRTFTWHPLFLP